MYTFIIAREKLMNLNISFMCKYSSVKIFIPIIDKNKLDKPKINIK